VWRDAYDALYSAGELRIHRFAIRGKPAVLAIRGAWPYNDTAVVSEIQRDIGLVRAFWRDDNFPYFLVTWAPFDAEHGSGDGTAFTNAIWIFSAKLDSLSTQVTQLTHEAFHAWDPRRMGKQVAGEAQRIGWFHEGFTMYYADLIAYRGGVLSLASVVERANQDLSNFAGSSDPYTRGEVIARWLDGAIRAHSPGKHSLDDMMRDMVRGSDTPLTLDRIVSTADRYLAPSDQINLRELATGSGPPPATLTAGPLASCVRVTLDSAYAFDAGFNVRESVAAHRVTGVKEGGAAYAAGMRDGQGLVGWSIYNGHSERPATFTIVVDSTRQRITYLPRGAGAIIPQLHAVDGAREGECIPASERLRP
jgi:predicted metalloprotease with PDZ domain